MIKLHKPVIVEGKYDKIKLSGIVSGTVIALNGFGIYKDKAKLDLIKRYADATGIIILTDSDSAGFQLRNYLKSVIAADKITHVYIPEIKGREKRKRQGSKAGTLGVEGIKESVLQLAFEKAGVLSECEMPPKSNPLFTTQMLFDDGLIGGENASYLRKEISKRLDLPPLMSTKALLDALNSFVTLEEYEAILVEINHPDTSE